ncbi:MAG: RsmB/NOP family class I SAM-dependent RNA methyltransferase [bacterium]|nr:RsmB/NOP family class I SAM-dependent RNA methyltransferase [bacterium]
MELAALLEDMVRLEEGAWSDRLLQDGSTAGAASARRTALVRYGLEEWRRHDWVLAARLRRAPRPRVQAALRLGLVLLEMGHPAHAVLDNLLETLSGVSATERGLVNAVLRGLVRDNQPLAPLPGPQTARSAEERRLLGVAFSLPPWFLDLIGRLEGPAAWQRPFLHRLRQDLYRGRGLWLRVNRQRWTAAEAEEDLARLGLEPSAAPECPFFLRLGRIPAAGLAQLPPLADGRLHVQDLSAWGALDLLDLMPGMRVLDLCAAPGGKSLAMLEACPGVELTAVEAHPGRARSLERRLAGRARLRQEDARAVTEKGWDRILLDLPCSGSGTVGHRPDILRKEDPVSPELLELQASLLSHATGLLAPGGRLVYSTCSMDPRENGQQVLPLAEREGLRPRPDLVPAESLVDMGREWRPWRSLRPDQPGRPGAGGAWAIALDKPARGGS